ncbi:MAG: alkaline phosphatase family protein [Acholeplasmataceae bacterium]|jgi:predicted AlkP superfamily pyrophosphatase or phosphodiesterase
MIDYKNNIINVTNSILKHYNAKTHYRTLPLLDDILKRNYKHVIVMLLDGLGINVLEKLGETSVFKEHLKTKLSTVFPPTTVAATNAFLAGKTPIETGFLGWSQYNKFEDATDEIFTRSNFFTGEKLDKNLYDYLWPKNFLKQAKEKNSSLHIEELYPSPIHGSKYKTFDSMLSRLLEINQGEASLCYCYYTEPDATIHMNGINSEKTLKVLKELNDKITNFKNKLLDDTLLIIVADHGIIDIEYVFLDDYDEIYKTFYRLPSIESRTQTFFVKENERNNFERLFNKYFQPGFKLYTKEELFKTNLFGLGEKHHLVDSFIGEYVAVSISSKAIGFKKEESPFKAHHAGYTKEELTIPLIIFE